MSKSCWRCKRELSLEQYQKDSSRPDGLSHCCRSCSSQRQREYHKKNPHKKFEYKLRQQFRMSVDEYERRLQEQGNACASCQGPFIREPHVDHNHDCCPGSRSCGRCVRGILCHWCNTAAGLVRNDPAIARALADYLEKGNNVSVQLQA